MKKQTREGLEAELAGWRTKLETLLNRQVGRPVELIARRMECQEIRGYIAEITAKLANMPKTNA